MISLQNERFRQLKKCGRLGQNYCSHRLWKAAQSAKNCPIWSHWTYTRRITIYLSFEYVSCSKYSMARTRNRRNLDFNSFQFIRISDQHQVWWSHGFIGGSVVIEGNLFFIGSTELNMKQPILAFGLCYPDFPGWLHDLVFKLTDKSSQVVK